MCEMIELDNEWSASLFVMVWGIHKMIQGDVKWFNREANGLRHTYANDSMWCRMIVKWLYKRIKLSYLPFYLRAGPSFDVKAGGSYFEKIILKLPPPKSHPSFLEMTPTHSLLPPQNFTFCECDFPPPSPAYSSYKSCWGSLCSNFLNKMMTDKSCCFIQDKNVDINNKTAKRKATWSNFPDIIFGSRVWDWPALVTMTCILYLPNFMFHLNLYQIRLIYSMI